MDDNLVEELCQITPDYLSALLNSLRNFSRLREHERATEFCDIETQLQQIRFTDRTISVSKFREQLDAIISSITTLGFLPEVDDHITFDSGQVNFKECVSNAGYSTQLLLSLLKHLVNHKDALLNNREWLKKSVIIPSLLLCSCHSREVSWSNRSIFQNCSEIQTVLQTLCGCTNTRSIFEKCDTFPDGLAKSFLKVILPKLTRDQWRRHIGYQCAFQFCLLQVKFPFLGTILEEVLPPSLLFVDDYNVDYQVMGVKCLSHILDNVNPTELRWYGRAEVVYSALEHLLYSDKVEIIPLLFPALMKILEIVEINPHKAVTQFTRYSKVLEITLENMEMQDKLQFRRLYPLYLPPLIELLGISVVRHMKVLLRVFANYLEIPDEPKEEPRILVLKAFQTLIKVAWPRIPFYTEDILKIFVKLLHDLRTGKLNAQTEAQLVCEAVEGLKLVKEVSPESFKELCEPLRELGSEIPARNDFVHLL